MNDRRRNRLREALEALSEARQIVDGVAADEQDSADNYPENLQGSDAYGRMETAADALSDAIEMLDEAEESIRTAIA